MSHAVPHMKNPPIILFIAKVEFSKIPQSQLDEKMEDFQEKFRRSYPEVEKGVIKNLSMEMSSKTLIPKRSDFQEEKVPVWIFKNAQFDTAVRITPGDLIFTSRNYTSSEDLLTEVEGLIEVLDEIFNLTHTRFVGIRCLNKIEPKVGKGADAFSGIHQKYIQSMLPFTKGMGGSNYSSRYKTEDGWLDIRVKLNVGGFDVPSDVRDLAVLVDFAKEPHRGKVFVTIDLDCKHVPLEYEEYNLDSLKNTLENLIYTNKQALAQIITDDEVKKRQ